MKVTLRLQELSDPMVFDDICSTYTKGPLYCLRLKDGDTLKFPLITIFSALESKAYTSQKNGVIGTYDPVKIWR